MMRFVGTPTEGAVSARDALILALWNCAASVDKGKMAAAVVDALDAYLAWYIHRPPTLVDQGPLDSALARESARHREAAVAAVEEHRHDFRGKQGWVRALVCADCHAVVATEEPPTIHDSAPVERPAGEEAFVVNVLREFLGDFPAGANDEQITTYARVILVRLTSRGATVARLATPEAEQTDLIALRSEMRRISELAEDHDFRAAASILDEIEMIAKRALTGGTRDGD